MYRLGLLLCDLVPEPIAERFTGYREVFRTAIERTGATVEWRMFDAFNGELPESIDACDGYLITGSRAGIDDDFGWIARLEGVVRDIAASGRPLVGLCFGHQLIARALGGDVEKSPNGWGIGLHRHRASAQKPWMTPELPEFILPVFHQDQVTELPPDSELLASNDHCRNFIIQFNEHTLGIQGHPEFSPDYVAALVELRSDILPQSVQAVAIASLQTPHHNREVMRWIARFLRVPNVA